MVVPTFGVTYTGAYEPVKDIADALDKLQADTGPRHRHPRRRRERRVPRAVLRAGRRVGLPASAGEVDQHVGSQVRPGAARRRLGGLARRRRAARRPDLPRDLPRRRHAGVPDQLLAPGRPDRRASTTTSCDSDARATGGCTWPSLRHGPDARARRSPSSGRSSSSATATRRPASRRSRGSIQEGDDPGYTLYDLADRLRIRGWQVPAYPLTGERVRHRRAAHPRAPGRQP